ncbi:protein mono-ADP-ribosyltransferase PARP15-like [Gigantopelta aegis]|uniref:protein mono-ADP-ribosyltransferase PARP15-like n=1 Tax=Gigantopelta aegis TaxID=1735272 RepID=UPI001B88DEA8|nr:protein mono-ADP-ribosyltransferase PARP15-like [Gigantopelta aegis]
MAMFMNSPPFVYPKEQKYRKLINSLLQKAETDGYNSIAFPPLGSGIIGYPCDKVVNALFETALAFRRNHLKSIIFVVPPNDSDKQKMFEREQARHFPERDKLRNIHLMKGDLAKQNVDVIVNSTCPKFESSCTQMPNADSAILLQKCKERYPRGIQAGQIAVTGNGNLPCKRVYHVILDKWSADGKTIRNFRNAIDKCFVQAAVDGFESMAFPVLGTGDQNYPTDVVCKVIFDSFSNFSHYNKRTSLCDITVIVHPDDTGNWRVFTDSRQLDVPPSIRPARRYSGAGHPSREEAAADDGFHTPPVYWTPMGEEEYIKIVQLPTGGDEYKSVAKTFTSTHPDAVVVQIERIQNKTLHYQYQAMKALFKANNPRIQNERTLWHAATSDNITSINATGFSSIHCVRNTTCYGRGVYFANDGTYAARDSQGYRYIYQALVLTGEFTNEYNNITIGIPKLPTSRPLYTPDPTEIPRHDMVVPPMKHGAAKDVRFDSVANGVNDPTRFVIFNETQAYPQYLITFQQNTEQKTEQKTETIAQFSCSVS